MIRPSALRAYDIRGEVGRDLDAEGARLLGGVYAALARERGLSRIGVSRDGRVTSPEFEAALLDGLANGGLHVTRIGLGPTPQLAFAVRHLGLDGGVMVTASHNPPRDNGFKLFLGAERLHGSALVDLMARPPAIGGGGSVATAEVTEAYVDKLLERAGKLRPLKVAWDCGNGATGPVVERLIPRLPGEHVLLHAVVDGRFPNHHPDPAVPANLRDLQAAVVRHACDLGIAFDGDGDRIGAVDGSGAVIWADQLLLLLARDLLRERPGSSVVADVKSSSVLFDGVAAAGGRPVMVPSGYVLVREAMRREGALLGGELSGHIFYADRWDGTDDALYVAVRLLLALSGSERTLAEFRASLPAMITTPEMRIGCPDERKGEVVAEVAERLRRAGATVNDADGVRVSTPHGWWLLRASGTEPKITCRCEAADEAGLERLMQQLRRELRESGVSI
ncbi:MAG TPA: phosphomannomutase/phosphoglucomutase [Caulobacteraceae bacterium]